MELSLPLTTTFLASIDVRVGLFICLQGTCSLEVSADGVEYLRFCAYVCVQEYVAIYIDLS